MSMVKNTVEEKDVTLILIASRFLFVFINLYALRIHQLYLFNSLWSALTKSSKQRQKHQSEDIK